MHRKETTDKKTKLIQEKCNTILNQLLRDEDNKYCCDCDSKGPRWASWNLGIFLCIRCAGIHRNLGVHISRVKSVNLDTWLPDQVVSLQQMGNSRARAVYEALLSDNFRRPNTDSGLESFIRAKYEQKKYIAREWIQPPPVKVNWDKEIEEEIENQKRKKKPTTSSSTTIPEPSKNQSPVPTAVSIPAPLPKPNSPKNPRVEAKKVTSSSSDLLGLTIPSPAASLSNPITDTFDFFSDVSSTTIQPPTAAVLISSQLDNITTKISTETSLKQEEDDFFSQKTVENGTEKGKLTKDSIMALYGNAPQIPQIQQQPQFIANFNYPMQDQFFSYGQQPGAALFHKAQTTNPSVQQQQQQQQQQFAAGTPQSGMMFNANGNSNNNNFGNFASFPVQNSQFNKLNEENLKKIESLNFNNFK
ncbi:unnamed protein product [Diamesa serratosioi]